MRAASKLKRGGKKSREEKAAAEEPPEEPPEPEMSTEELKETVADLEGQLAGITEAFRVMNDEVLKKKIEQVANLTEELETLKNKSSFFGLVKASDDAAPLTGDAGAQQQRIVELTSQLKDEQESTSAKAEIIASQRDEIKALREQSAKREQLIVALNERLELAARQSADAGAAHQRASNAAQVTLEELAAVRLQCEAAAEQMEMVGADNVRLERLLDAAVATAGTTSVGALEASLRGGAAAAQLAVRDEGEIGPESFVKLGLLGKGAVGRAYLVKRKSGDNRLYAMKTLSKAEMKKRKKTRRMLLEKEVLAQVEHPFVISLYWSFQSEDYLYHVMEFCPGGEFYQLCKRQPEGRLTEAQAKFYMAEIVLALEYLHSKEFLYRDMKPENILMGADGHIRMTDFDLAHNTKGKKIKVVEDGEVTEKLASNGKSFVGTIEYVSPEIIMGTPHTVAVDWWIVGIMAYEMLHSVTPFRAKTERATFENIIGKEPVFPKPKSTQHKVSREAKDFIKKLLAKDWETRLGTVVLEKGQPPDMFAGAKAVKEHAWFKDIDWDKLKATQPPIIPVTSFRSEKDELGRSAAAMIDLSDKDQFRLFGQHYTRPRGAPDKDPYDDKGIDPFEGFDVTTEMGREADAEVDADPDPFAGKGEFGEEEEADVDPPLQKFAEVAVEPDEDPFGGAVSDEDPFGAGS